MYLVSHTLCQKRGIVKHQSIGSRRKYHRSSGGKPITFNNKTICFVLENHRLSSRKYGTLQNKTNCFVAVYLSVTSEKATLYITN